MSKIFIEIDVECNEKEELKARADAVKSIIKRSAPISIVGDKKIKTKYELEQKQWSVGTTDGNIRNFTSIKKCLDYIFSFERENMYETLSLMKDKQNVVLDNKNIACLYCKIIRKGNK